MYSEQYNQWIKANKQFTLPLVEWNRLSSEWCQRATQQHLDLIGDQFTRVSDQMKRFTTVKKPEDFLSLQKECLQENVSATILCIQTVLQHTMENLETFTKMCATQQESAINNVNSNKSTERSK